MSVLVAPMPSPDARTRSWTDEQREAIERREGNLLLSAGAGSGKTSVLVERFVRSVVQDGIGVGEILTITFTEKAAAEMRDRIRARLRELGQEEAATATEGAVIATIHGFCAQVLRAHALDAGLDPAFAILDEHDASELAGGAFDAALEDMVAAEPETIDLIAAHTAPGLRNGVRAVYAQLRSRGQAPVLAPLAPGPALAPALAELRRAAAAVQAELSALPDPGVKVRQALERLARCAALGQAVGAEPWPGELDALCLPGGNGAALSTEACAAYGEALARARAACEQVHAARAHRLMAGLLERFAARYAAAKRERSALDFEDLELMARALLHGDEHVRAHYRARFRRVMVDELQDTNSVQLELIAAVADGNLFTVGDAQQAIYGFRNADVELFERLAAQRAREGRHATLQVNFRSRPEILDVINSAFAAELGERFTPLVAGREVQPAGDPRVELIVVDKGADWEGDDSLAAPWRLAEARALAARVAELVGAGTAPRDVVVLTRATTDLRTYERALEAAGVPTYLIGGRGYWGHPQVLDVVSYLRVLANPLDEEALYTVLASPMVGASMDALVLAGAAGDPWSALAGSGGRLAGLQEDDAARLAAFVGLVAGERALVGEISLEALIDRALERTGYDVAVLALPGGRRRLANVRKLMRLAREHEAAHGPELRGFLELVDARSRGRGADARESEAPVEGEALDAVRLMTIHRSKGLEFDTVCVADLGRVRRTQWDLIRLGADGRIGLRLSPPGSAKATQALDYKALGDERQATEADEERRLFYVAMTRARERLVLSGAAKLDGWPQGNGGSPISWIAPALVPEFATVLADGGGVSEGGVAYRVLREAPPAGQPGAPQAVAIGTPAVAIGTPAVATEAPAVAPGPGGAPELGAAPGAAPAAGPGAPVTRLSYSALTLYRRCGYRFYVERVLGLPPDPGGALDPAGALEAGGAPGPGAALSALDRGVLAHALLEQLDFRRPLEPGAEAIAAAARVRGLPAPGPGEADELQALVRAFAASNLCARLARATQVRREQRFGFLLGPELLVTGALDVVAREREGLLVLDYKTDRLAAQTPTAVVERDYAIQRLIYALAVLGSGAARVEVAHVFLERPDEPAIASYTAADAPALEQRLEALAAGVRERRFEVAEHPHRGLCAGCPAQGGLCSWPEPMTRRERPDQLF